jgi:hypothetical protein
VLAYRVNCIRKVVRVAGLTMRDGNRLELCRECRLIHDAAFRQLMNERRKTDIVASTRRSPGIFFEGMIGSHSSGKYSSSTFL